MKYDIVNKTFRKFLVFIRKEVLPVDQIKALFKKIKGGDRASFTALSDQYGWKLYSYIRRNTPDRDTADRIFSETFSRFYASMDRYDSEDPIETMLYVYADQAGSQEQAGNDTADLSKWEIGHESGFSLPEVELPKKSRESTGLRIVYGFCIALLSAGILLSIWVMVGMLMNMNLIPYVDLGYDWFNVHIFDIFH